MTIEGLLQHRTTERPADKVRRLEVEIRAASAAGETVIGAATRLGCSRYALNNFAKRNGIQFVSTIRGDKLDHSTLLRLLSYDASTGAFHWAADRRPDMKVGDLAGRIDQARSAGQTPYWRITVMRKRYGAHRLAWFYVHGQWPIGEIDHINGNGLDNRITNLREVSRTENAQNIRKARADSKSGLLGVTSGKGRGFAATIRVNGILHWLGLYPTAEEAHAAYVTAKRQLHAGCTI